LYLNVLQNRGKLSGIIFQTHYLDFQDIMCSRFCK